MDGSTHDLLGRELDQLRGSRDELRLQAHLGRMEARELLAQLEDRFEDIESRTRRLARESGEALEEAGDEIGEAIEDLRKGYERLREQLTKSGATEGLWLRVCVAIDRLMSQGARATERVVDSLDDLGDRARLRVEKARRERELLEKCAALGTRVFERARERAGDAVDAAVLDDELVSGLLGEIGELEERLDKIRVAQRAER